jgi:hypothetical protein
MEHRRFNPAVVLVFVNSRLDLSVDTFSRAGTFSRAVPVVSEAMMWTLSVVFVRKAHERVKGQMFCIIEYAVLR